MLTIGAKVALIDGKLISFTVAPNVKVLIPFVLHGFAKLHEVKS